jgi:hypothetical protein
LKHDPQKFKAKIQRVQNLIDQGKLKRMEFVCSIDCWGPEIEYVRDGLILAEWEQNMTTLLNAPGVGVLVHATLTALTLPTLHQLIEKTNEWRKIKETVGINWNTVVRPSTFNPYNFGKYLAPFIDASIQELENYSSPTEREKLQIHLRGIQQQLLTAPIDKKEVNDCANFLDEIDKRRNRNWRAIFPKIVDIVNTINKEEPNHV